MATCVVLSQVFSRFVSCDEVLYVSIYLYLFCGAKVLNWRVSGKSRCCRPRSTTLELYYSYTEQPVNDSTCFWPVTSKNSCDRWLMIELLAYKSSDASDRSRSRSHILDPTCLPVWYVVQGPCPKDPTRQNTCDPFFWLSQPEELCISSTNSFWGKTHA